MKEAAPQSAAETSPTKSERNPVEKLIVRILIIAMLILVVIEAHARIGYSMTLSKLEQALQLDDEGEPLNTEDVPSLVSGFPSKTVHENMSYTYRWTSLVKSYGINVAYDDDKHVTGLVTDLPPEIPFGESGYVEEMIEGEEYGAEHESDRPTNEETFNPEGEASPAEEVSPAEVTPEVTETPAPAEESQTEPASN